MSHVAVGPIRTHHKLCVQDEEYLMLSSFCFHCIGIKVAWGTPDRIVIAMDPQFKRKDIPHGWTNLSPRYGPDNCTNEDSEWKGVTFDPASTNLLALFITHQKACGIIVLPTEKAGLWVAILLTGNKKEKKEETFDLL